MRLNLGRETVRSRDVDSRTEKPSFWQLVFSQSKVNGAPYSGDQLLGHNWNWPRGTYLQRRLQQTKWYQSTDKANLN
jgi:hypothetical protein